jgi:hypothetical protein
MSFFYDVFEIFFIYSFIIELPRTRLFFCCTLQDTFSCVCSTKQNATRWAALLRDFYDEVPGSPTAPVPVPLEETMREVRENLSRLSQERRDDAAAESAGRVPAPQKDEL